MSTLELTAMVSLFVVIFVIDIIILVFWILSIVDIAKRPDWQWKFAGRDKMLWLILVILVNVVSPFYHPWRKTPSARWGMYSH